MLAELFSCFLCLAELACSRKPVDNACGPLRGPPIVLSSGPHTVGGISTDATNVYWVELGQDGSIKTIPKGGGSSRAVAPARGGSASATDDEYVYWTYAPGEVWRAPKAGGAAHMLASSETKIAQAWTQLALDETFVYWVNMGSQKAPPGNRLGQVMKVAKSGGPVTVIASEQKGVADVVVNEGHVFWATQDGVWRWSKTAKSIERFIDTPTSPPMYGLALDDAYLYWSDGSAVRRSPLAGGKVGKVEVVFSSPAAGMLLQGSCLYLVAYSATVPSLLRVGKAGDAEFPHGGSSRDAQGRLGRSTASRSRSRAEPGGGWRGAQRRGRWGPPRRPQGLRGADPAASTAPPPAGRSNRCPPTPAAFLNSPLRTQ
jgi:hypothetical protein